MRGAKTGGRVTDEGLLDAVERYIREHQRQNGKSPTLRQIMRAFPRGFPNLSKVQRYVVILKRDGRIEDDNGKIGIEWRVEKNKDTVMIPQIGTVTCGEPILAVEEYEENNEVPASWFGRGELFMLKAKGSSTIGKGIQDGELLVIRKQNAAEYGQAVVALIGDEATIKTYRPECGRIVLHPENPQMQDIIVAPDECRVIGIVIGCVHRFAV